jgi:HSP20 family protein
MLSFFEKLKGGVQKEEIKEEIKIKEKPKRKVRKDEAKSGEKPKEWLEPEGQLAIDVYQTDSDIVIQAPIAGVKKENLDISIENDVVTIRGNREKPSEVEEKNYFYQECYWGPFSREIILPDEGDPSRAEAEMKEGILTLRIPRIQREKVKKVEIRE